MDSYSIIYQTSQEMGILEYNPNIYRRGCQYDVIITSLYMYIGQVSNTSLHQV